MGRARPIGGLCEPPWRLLLTNQLQAVLRLQLRHQVSRVVQPVLDREVRPSLLDPPGAAGRGCLRQFLEESLKPSRDDHFNGSDRIIGGIPERVSDTTRLVTLDPRASAATPARNQESGGRLPGLDAGHRLHGACRNQIGQQNYRSSSAARKSCHVISRAS
jgi:hypothetical protein